MSKPHCSTVDYLITGDEARDDGYQVPLPGSVQGVLVVQDMDPKKPAPLWHQRPIIDRYRWILVRVDGQVDSCLHDRPLHPSIETTEVV